MLAEVTTAAPGACISGTGVLAVQDVLLAAVLAAVLDLALA